MKPTVISWLTESVEKRKKAKKELDSVIALGNKENAKITHLNAYLSPYGGTTRVRMIDEGAIPYDDGSVRIFIAKGTIEKFVNNLPNDYVGYINLGHMSLGSLPLLLGTWTKSDLHIVDTENGRKGLDVDLHFNEELSIVQDLRKQGLPISYSVEMLESIDEDLSNTLDMPVLTEMFIMGISVVGDPANVSSYGMNLSKGDEDMGIKDLLNSISQEEKLENVEETVDETVEETASETVEQQEEVVEETTNEVETLENEVEEVETLENEEVETEEEVEQVEETTEETISTEEVDTLSNYIEKLTATVKQLQQENKMLQKELQKVAQEKQNLSNTVEKSIGKIETLIGEKKEKENLSNERKTSWYYWG